MILMREQSERFLLNKILVKKDSKNSKDRFCNDIATVALNDNNSKRLVTADKGNSLNQ